MHNLIEEDQLLSISEEIRAIRKERNMSLRDLAEACELSAAMLSKIENRRSIPSLSTLLSIAKALEVELIDLLGHIKADGKSPWLLFRKDSLKKIEKEDAVNFDISFIHSLSIQKFSRVELNHIALGPGSQRDKVETEGVQYVYLTKGKLDFELGDEVVKMEAGDALYFEGAIPHVPKNVSKRVAELLVIYLLQ